MEFIDWISEWNRNLRPVKLGELKSPGNTALISVDMVEGFCHEGNLASPRIKNIIPAVVDLFKKTYDFGVRDFVLLQDTHDINASEFTAYPPHCVRGTKEAETIPELTGLTFANLFTVIKKNSISPAINTDFDSWLGVHKNTETFIIAGNCTDLCVYSTAMYLKMRSDALNLRQKIVIAENCVQTYDMSIETAKKLHVMPHDGDLLHKLFLYHMELNGINIVKEIKL